MMMAEPNVVCCIISCRIVRQCWHHVCIIRLALSVPLKEDGVTLHTAKNQSNLTLPYPECWRPCMKSSVLVMALGEVGMMMLSSNWTDASIGMPDLVMAS